MSTYIDFVCEDTPEPAGAEFVEVENDAGQGIRFGEWVRRADGYWALRFTMADVQKVLE